MYFTQQSCQKRVFDALLKMCKESYMTSLQ